MQVLEQHLETAPMDESPYRPPEEKHADRHAVDELAHEHVTLSSTATIATTQDEIADRARQAIAGHGFPPLVVEDGEVVLSGFVIEPQGDQRVDVRWIGSRT
jgi:hypothetical protein